MNTSFTPVEIFCSFAEADTPLLEQLERHLSLLRQQNYLSTWHRQCNIAGQNWQAQINQHLDSASLILLLISSDFLNADYWYGTEMQRALQRHNTGDAQVIPILLRPCDWQTAPFAELDVLPTGAKPVVQWTDRDAAWTNVAMNLRRILTGVAGTDEKQEKNTMDAGNNSGDANFNGPVTGEVVVGKVIAEQFIGKQITYMDKPKDGIRSLETGSQALWNGDYAVARKELRIATEVLEQDKQPEAASRAYCFLAFALLEGKLPRTHVKEIIGKIEYSMGAAIKIYPYASYYHIFACIKRDFLTYHRFHLRLKEIDLLESLQASSTRCDADDEIEAYFRQCQPRLPI